jgi:uncharacterized protein YdeI (YjbR/CyaY-like superfamily)
MTPPKRQLRERYPMPEFMRTALAASGLMVAYEQRPPYQRNDYIGWIMKAKLPVTRQKRLTQMLDELAKGGVYMKMEWRGKT